MVFDAGQKRIGCPVEDLNRSTVGAEGPMPHKLLNGKIIRDDKMWLLHVEIIKQVSNTIATVKRASNNMIQTQSRFPVVNDLFKGFWKIRTSNSELRHKNFSMEERYKRAFYQVG